MKDTLGKEFYESVDKTITIKRQQTAVEWLCNQIYTIQVELEAGNTKLKNKIEQANIPTKKKHDPSVAHTSKTDTQCWTTT